MDKNIIKTLFVSFILFLGVFFINTDGVKADCSCYYIWSKEGNNADVKTEAYFYAEIKYSSSGAETVKNCGFGYVANQNGTRDIATTNTNGCTGKLPIDNHFNVDYQNIVNNNCSKSACNAKKIYIKPNANVKSEPGSFTTDTNTALYSASQAQDGDIFEKAIEGNISRTENADNNNNAQNINKDEINGGIKKAINPEEGTIGACNLIPQSIRDFLKNLFTIIQVIGILLLIVLTLIEFVKALTASSEDGLKGAFKSTIKRIIAAVILLLLPMIIIFIIDIVNSNYSDSHTQIGEDGNPVCIY